MAKRTKKATKANVLKRALEIQESEGIKFVRAMIRARKEFGLISENVGKERVPASA